MGTPEDVAAERYFTPPDERTLTEMLKVLGYREDVELAKKVFKNWLRKVGLTYCGTPEATRQLLIILVDEP